MSAGRTTTPPVTADAVDRAAAAAVTTWAGRHVIALLAAVVVLLGAALAFAAKAAWSVSDRVRASEDEQAELRRDVDAVAEAQQTQEQARSETAVQLARFGEQLSGIKATVEETRSDVRELRRGRTP